MLRLALAATALQGRAALARAAEPPITVRAFRLAETDGFRRSTYPIHATLEGAGLAPRSLLTCDGKPIEAQFRPVVAGKRHDLALDFEASLDPFEVRRYEVHYGLGVEPGPEPRGGLKVERVGDGLRIAWPGGIAFAVGPDLHAPFLEAGSARLAFLRPGRSGLSLRAGEPTTPIRGVQPARITVTRQGPLAVGVRLESDPIEGGRIASIDLTFPRSQTWAEVALTTSDPAWDRWDPRITLALGFDPDGRETRKGPGWASEADRERRIIVAARDPGVVLVEPGREISIGLDRARRDLEPRKTLNFRVQFEPRPGPVGSATGPESMIRPPRVDWDRPRTDP